MIKGYGCDGVDDIYIGKDQTVDMKSCKGKWVCCSFLLFLQWFCFQSTGMELNKEEQKERSRDRRTKHRKQR